MPARHRCARCERDKKLVARGLCTACYQADRRAKVGPLYATWVNMVQRCTNPSHPRYHRYGGRGITIDPRWMDYSTFVEDVGQRPEDPADWTGKRPYWSIDRIDNDGPYTPGNVRWASASDQARNREPGYQLSATVRAA